MKKKITYLIGIIVILAFLIFLFTTTSYAGTQKLNDLRYDVVLNEDGSADVVETWNIRVSETNTLFKTFELDSKKYGNITNVEVSEVNLSGEVTNFQDTGAYAYHVKKGGFYALNRPGSEFEIAWGVSIEDTETRTYRIKYKIENAIKTYTDCSEFYWQFIGDTNGIPAKKVTGTIALPKEVLNRDNLKVWAHGPLHGNITIVDNKTASFEVEDLETNTMVEVRVVTAENVFSQNMNKVNTSKLNSIVEEETKWADEANAQREAARKAVMTVIFIAGVITFAFLAIFTFVIVRYIKVLKSIKKIAPEQEMKYFRDFPDENATPAEAAFLYYFDKQGAFRNNVSKIVSATILNLALKEIILFEQDEKNNVYIVLNKGYKEVKNTDESDVYNILVNVEEYIQRHSKEEQDRIRISMKDIENYAKKNDQIFLSKIEGIEGRVKTVQKDKENYDEEAQRMVKKWRNKSATYYAIGIVLIFFGFMAIIPIFIAILLFVCGILCGKIAKKSRNLTQKGANEKEAWKGLKRYMEDFSLLNEREVPDLILWEKYLVYATAFGIADKVLAQLKIKYPQFMDESYMISNGYTYMYMMNRMNFDRMIMSGINKAYNTSLAQRQARIAASSYSSRRRWWSEDSLAEVGGRRWWRPEWAEDKENEECDG